MSLQHYPHSQDCKIFLSIYFVTPFLYLRLEGIVAANSTKRLSRNGTRTSKECAMLVIFIPNNRSSLVYVFKSTKLNLSISDVLLTCDARSSNNFSVLILFI